MSDQNNPQIGSVGWMDLTVENADAIRDFYHEVVGWNFTGLDMGGYSDYCMAEPATDKMVSGICHARGPNAELPPVWLIYIYVEDLDKSLARCLELGGKAVTPIKSYVGQGRHCVIRDPAGAYAALFESAK
ncbi:MAG: VOC family protein [Acidobacteriota bacterium]|nr:VOC family protein [Acidobacteriota bacterium]